MMIIGRYEVQKLLKHNPIFQWFEAIDIHKNETVILQIFHHTLNSESQDSILTYFDDLQAIQRQPIWSPIHSFVNLDSSIVLVYPFLQTTSLYQVLQQSTLEEATNWWQQASEALHILHNANLVHGYVTLDSFFVFQQNLYLTGFGYTPLLKLGYPEAIEICKNSLAPEFFETRKLTPASDIYAFAKTVTSFHPQLTETSWYFQAIHDSAENRFQRMRPLFISLQKAFQTTDTSIVSKYLLQTRVEPFESGYVLSESKSYLADKIASITANPSHGWIFDRWSGDISSFNSAVQLKMDADKTLVANFIEKKPTNEIIVSSIGSKHYESLSKAVRNAQPYSRIRVRPGIYREEIILDKPLQIIGEGAKETIIIDAGYAPCLLMKADHASVCGLTLRCRADLVGNQHFAVDIQTGELLLENCNIQSDSLACIAIHGSKTNPIIRNCDIYNNKASGINIYNGGQATIENCDIFSHFKGIEISEGSNPSVCDCRFNNC